MTPETPPPLPEQHSQMYLTNVYYDYTAKDTSHHWTFKLEWNGCNPFSGENDWTKCRGNVVLLDSEQYYKLKNNNLLLAARLEHLTKIEDWNAAFPEIIKIIAEIKEGRNDRH